MNLRDTLMAEEAEAEALRAQFTHSRRPPEPACKPAVAQMTPRAAAVPICKHGSAA